MRSRPVTRTLIALAMVATLGSSSTPGEELQLNTLLIRLGRVAGLYRDRALRFTCDELIIFDPPKGRPKRHRFHYVYAYDGDHLRDYRVLRKQRKKEHTARKVDLGEYGLPAFVVRAYSSTLLFESKTREHYRYRLVGPARALGRPAVKVAFEPETPDLELANDWYGAVWIDLDTYQLLRFEGVKADDHLRKQRLERGQSASRIVIQRITTEFAVEKHGLRFPSEVMIEASLLVAGDSTRDRALREYTLYTVRQRYSDYRFYGVETHEAISRIVAAGAESAE